MISVVIPTKNRAYTLEKVLPSYYLQSQVTEVIVVDDGGEDETEALLNSMKKAFPAIATVYVKNETSKGASLSKNKGAECAKNAWILIGEDDAYLEENYTQALLAKFQDPTVGIASGRMIDLKEKEEPKEAIARFGRGDPKKTQVFDAIKFSHVPDAYFIDDINLPLTHAMILTKKELVLRYPFDTHYAKGNGFREESDFQVNAFIHGWKIVCTNDTHAMHMNRQEVKQGGHRTSLLNRVKCNILHTHYFYQKYYCELKRKLPLSHSRFFALARFTFAELKEVTTAVMNKYVLGH